MNVKARIRFKAKKMLGPMLSYSSFDSSALPDNLASFLSTNEKAIGVYKNSCQDPYDYKLSKYDKLSKARELLHTFIKEHQIS